MMFDHCTWDDDYKKITQEIRRELLELAHVDEKEYTAVLMQGSGTFGVESVLTSVIGSGEKLLIAANGAYEILCARRRRFVLPFVRRKYIVYHRFHDFLRKTLRDRSEFCARHGS